MEKTIAKKDNISKLILSEIENRNYIKKNNIML